MAAGGGVAGEAKADLSARVGDATVGLTAAFVSGNYFDVLGTMPQHGRLLTRVDGETATMAAVVSDRFWRDRLGARDDALGSALIVGGQSVQIVGIAPRRFAGWELANPFEDGDSRRHFDVWLPLSAAGKWPGRAPRSLTPIVRHRPGAERGQVERDLGALVPRLQAVTPPNRDGTPRRLSIRLRPHGFGPEDTGAEVAVSSLVVLVGPAVLLVIACANVANLRLAAATERIRELAVRLSLGGTRARVVRLLLLESIVVAVPAVAGGLFVTELILAVASSLVPLDVQLDWRVLLFCSGLGAGVVMLTGLAPALLVTRRVLSSGLRQSPQAGGLSHARLRHALVAVQVACALALLIVVGVLGRSLQALRARVPAVVSETVTGDLDFEKLGYDVPATAAIAARMLGRLGADTRISAAALSSVPLFSNREVAFNRPGGSFEKRFIAHLAAVSPSWFATMGQSVLAGRSFTTAEGRDRLVVNQTLAETFAPGRSMLGEALEVRAFQGRTDHWTAEVIGVVADGPPWLTGRGEARPEIFLPFAAATGVAFSFVARTIDPGVVVPDVTRLITSLEPRGPWIQVQTASAVVARETAPWRVTAQAASALGGVALLLATTGLYAVMAYVVSLRRREMGIRMALGAGRADVMRLVLREALGVVIAGALVGGAAGLGVAQLLRGAFIGVSPLDPAAVAPPVVVLFASVLLAAIIPAGRAAQVDPVVALRQD